MRVGELIEELRKFPVNAEVRLRDTNSIRPSWLEIENIEGITYTNTDALFVEIT